MPTCPIVLISPGTSDHGTEFADFSINLSMAYPKAVTAAGGLPWILPCDPDPRAVHQTVRRADGILLTGGQDVAPKQYTKSLPAGVRKTIIPAHPARDALEFLLVKEAFRQRKPLLCICRGHQLLNVALGGTLTADINLQIPQALNHSQTDRKDQLVHLVSCTAGSLMARIAGRKQLGVNSSHHQAVARIASDLRATAISQDGIVEGMELARHAQGLLPWLLSVQFHPERLFRKHAEHLKLFQSFVRACSRMRRSQV